MLAPSEFQNWTILMVDDRPDNLFPLRRVLQHIGITVLVASDGLQGLEALTRERPNVILVDLSMPVMDGWQMLAEVKKNPATAEIPMIAVTAHAMAGDKAKALAAGFDGYITKPFRPSEFLNILRKALVRI